MIAVTRLRRYLDLARQGADAANVAKSNFLAMMSHEMRTPMTGILGITDLLLEENLPADQKERVTKVSKSGRQLLDMLNDLLDLSKIEANRLAIENVAFRLSDVIADAFDLLSPIAQEKNIELRLDHASDIRDDLVGDPVRIRQVLINLLGNAVKFTATGGVTVKISQTVADRDRIELSIEVADTGIGIALADQARLFQPFAQAEGRTWRRYGGTGLGLTISRRLVEMMGGRIIYSTAEGEGSTFTFTVAVTGNLSGSPAAQAAPERQTARAARKLRILVADDNETIRYLLNAMLSRWGHRADCVADGAAAVTAVETRAYDVVLMDMQMPGMDGVDATRAIRKLTGDLARVPVIALTADVVPGQRAAYLKAGVNAVIGKPVDWAALSEELEHQCAEGVDNVGRGGRARGEPVVPEVPPAEAVSLDPAALASLREDIGAEDLLIMLGKFRKNLAEYGAQLSEIIEAEDLQMVRRTAHGLKGLCMQFGAMRVGALARKMESVTASADDMRAAMKELECALIALDRDLAAQGATA